MMLNFIKKSIDIVYISILLLIVIFLLILQASKDILFSLFKSDITNKKTKAHKLQNKLANQNNT